MSYNLTKDNEIKDLTYFSYHFKGLSINTKNHGRKNMISASKMIITDDDLINDYINIRLDKRFKNLVKLVFEMLSTEGETAEDVGNILGEIDKLKSIIENKYKYYLNVLEYEKFMKKLFLIEKQLKEKIIEIEMNNYYYDEEKKEITDRSR